MAAHGYVTDPASLGDGGSWTQLNERDLTDVEEPLLPHGFRFRTAEEAGPQAAGRATHRARALAPSTRWQVPGSGVEAGPRRSPSLPPSGEITVRAAARSHPS
jgi:hypothetical protein